MEKKKDGRKKEEGREGKETEATRQEKKVKV